MPRWEFYYQDKRGWKSFDESANVEINAAIEATALSQADPPVQVVVRHLWQNPNGMNKFTNYTINLQEMQQSSSDNATVREISAWWSACNELQWSWQEEVDRRANAPRDGHGGDDAGDNDADNDAGDDAGDHAGDDAGDNDAGDDAGDAAGDADDDDDEAKDEPGHGPHFDAGYTSAVQHDGDKVQFWGRGYDEDKWDEPDKVSSYTEGTVPKQSLWQTGPLAPEADQSTDQSTKAAINSIGKGLRNWANWL